MAKIARVKTTLRDADKIATVWKENPSFVVGSLNFDGFNALYKAVSGVNKDCSGREDELVGLKKIRDDQTRQLQDLVTRFRGAARAHFGPDSAEYAQAGGTPVSARKSITRKAKPDSAQPKPASV